MKRMVAISLMLWVTMSYAMERDLESDMPHNGNNPSHQPLLDYHVYQQQNGMHHDTPINAFNHPMPQEQSVYLPQSQQHIVYVPHRIFVAPRVDRLYTNKSIAMVAAAFCCMAVLKIYIGYDTHH